MFSKSLFFVRVAEKCKTAQDIIAVLETCVDDHHGGHKDCSQGDATVAAHPKGVYV